MGDRRLSQTCISPKVAAERCFANDVGSRTMAYAGRPVACPLDAARPIFCRSLGTVSSLARNDVFGVPVRPVVLRSGRFVLPMTLLCFLQKLSQRGDVRAESSSGKLRRNLLQQPAVAVRITERGE